MNGRSEELVLLKPLGSLVVSDSLRAVCQESRAEALQFVVDPHAQKVVGVR